MTQKVLTKQQKNFFVTNKDILTSAVNRIEELKKSVEDLKQQAIKDKYNVVITMQSLDNFLRDTKIYGHYRGNDSYCEAYVDKNTYDYLQEILDKNIKSTPSKQVYMFSGLIRCPKCDRLMSGTHNNNANPTLSYRCNNHVMYKVCKNNKRVNENKVEKHLLENTKII